MKSIEELYKEVMVLQTSTIPQPGVQFSDSFTYKKERRITMAIFKKHLSEEESKKLTKENKLSKEDLEAIDGGYVYNENFVYYAIINDETGGTLGRGYRKNAAEERAQELGVSTTEISWEQLQRLRETGHI